jgi:hypothetical protein
MIFLLDATRYLFGRSRPRPYLTRFPDLLALSLGVIFAIPELFSNTLADNDAPVTGVMRHVRTSNLRYTFALHRITSWILKNADPNRMLRALAAYMGHSGLWATERYPLMSPERFRKSLKKLSPTHSRIRWLNDPKLMKFLVKL